MDNINWVKEFASLDAVMWEYNWIPGRLGVKDGSGGYEIDTGRTNEVYVSLGVNGERGQATAINAINADSIEWQSVKMRRENGQLVIRQADYIAGGSGGSSTLVGLTDVVFTGLADGDLLSYDSGSGNWVNLVPAGGSGDAPSPHALNSAHHSGTLANSQAPQFLLMDGTRALEGNLSVDIGVTIDGIDISAHAANANAHHNAVTVGNTGLSLSTQVLSLNLATDSGLEISSGVRVKAYHGIERTSNGTGVKLKTTSGLEVDTNGLAVADSLAGSGLGISSKALSVNVSNGLEINSDNVRVNQAFSFTWTGTHQFNVDPQINANLDFIGSARTITSAANLTVSPTGDLILDPSGLILFGVDQEMKSSTFSDLVTGINGFRLWERSDASNYYQLTIGAMKMDELYARVFVADETRIDRGEEYWSKSYGIVEEDFDLPDIAGTVDVWFENATGVGTGNIFSVNDWLLFRTIDWSTGILIQKVWFQVTSLLTAGTVDGYRQRWRLTRKKFGTTATTIKKGSTALDAGQVGQGWLHLSALAQDGGPFFQVGDFTSIVSNEPIFTNRVRLGNLNGTVDYATDAWGTAAGNNLGTAPSAGFSGYTVDATNGLRLFNTDVVLYQSTTKALSLTRGEGLSILQDTGDSANRIRLIGWYDNLNSLGGTPNARVASYDTVNGAVTTRNLLVSANASGANKDASVNLRASQGTPFSSVGINIFSGTTTYTFGDLTGIISFDAPNIVMGGRVKAGPDGNDEAVSVFHVKQDDTATAAGAGLTVENEGTGDAVIHLIAGTDSYSMGVDQSDSGRFKFALNSDLTTSSVYIIDATTRNVGIGMSTTVPPARLTVVATSPEYEAARFVSGSGSSGSVQGTVYIGLDPKTPSWTYPSVRLGSTEFDILDHRSDFYIQTRTTDADVEPTTQMLVDHLGRTIFGTSAPAPVARFTVWESSAGVASGAGLTIQQAGAGDSVLHWVRGTDVFSAGIDATDGFWKLSLGYQLGTTDIMVVDTVTGIVTVAGLSTTGGGSAHDPATAGTGISIVGQVISVDGTVVINTRAISTNGGITGGGNLSANRTLSIDLATNSGLNTTSGLAVGAGNGLSATLGVLAVNVGDGIEIVADAVAIDLATTSGLSITSGLAVGAGAGISVLTSTVAIALASPSGLNTTGGLNVNDAIAGDGLLMSASKVIDVVALSTGGLQANANNIQIKLGNTGNAGLQLDSSGVWIHRKGDTGLASGISMTAVDGIYLADSLAGSGLAWDVSDRILNISTGNGLEISSDAVRVNQAFAFTWTANHIWNTATARFNGTLEANTNLAFIGARSVTSTGNLAISPTGTLTLSPSGNMILAASGDLARTTSFSDLVTGISGMRMWDDGANYIRLTMGAIKIDELYARVFVADETRIDRGEEYWSKSYGIVETDFVLPADEATVSVWFENATGVGTGNLFSVGDWLLFRSIDWSTGISIIKAWFTVVSLVTAGTVDGYRQRWSIKRESGGTTGATIKKGNVALDAGQIGQGWIHLSALAQDGGPFIQIGQFDSIFSSDVPVHINHVRMGALDGVAGYSGAHWGLAAGNDLSLDPALGAFSGFTVDDIDGLRLFNTEIELYEASDLLVSLTQDNGLRLQQDTNEFATPALSIAWYSDLDPLGTLRGRLSSFDSGTESEIQLTSFATGTGNTASVSIGANQQTPLVVAGLTIYTSAPLVAGSSLAALDAVLTSISSTKTLIGTGLAYNNTASTLHVHESNTSTTTAGVTIQQASTGDSVVHFIVPAQTWSLGIDNSVASDPLVISASGALGTSNALTLTTAGLLTLAGGLTATGALTVTGTASISTSVTTPLVKAASSAGLQLQDDGGNLGVFVQDSTGFVGIATAVPAYPLHVLGNGAMGALNGSYIVSENLSSAHLASARVVNDAGGVFTFTAYGSAFAGSTFGETRAGKGMLIWAGTATSMVVGTALAAELGFATNDTRRMTIASDGFVGVGTTTPGTDIVGTYDYGATIRLLQVDGAQSRLMVRGSTNAALDLIDTGAVTDEKWMQLHSESGVTRFRAMSDTGTVAVNNIMAIEHDTGVVGIGTATPAGTETASRFTVQGSDASTFYTATINTGAGQVGTAWRRTGGTASRWVAYIPEGVDGLSFFNNTWNKNVLTLGSNGLVGVNNDTADSVMHVHSETAGLTSFKADHFGTGAFSFIGRRANGSKTTPTNVASGNTIASFGALGYTSGGWATATSGEISFVATEAFSTGIGGQGGAELSFWVRANGAASVSKAMTVLNDRKIQMFNVYGVTVTTPRNVFIDSTGVLGGISSSRKTKENISAPGASYFEKLLENLKPVFFSYKADGNHTKQLGMIAEDVHDTGATELVDYDNDGNPISIAYHLTGVVAIGMAQSIDRHVASLEATVVKLMNRVNELEKRLAA